MKRWLTMLMLVTLAAVLAPAQLGPGPTIEPRNSDKNNSSSRELVGQVTNRGDKPLANAVVYLNNTRTMAVTTRIADQNGNYRFPGLAQNTDYEVFAEYDGKKSDRKTLSGFDSRSKAYINLKIDVAAK
jgi:hypothetical protein